MRNSLAAKESFIGIQRVFCCQLHNLPASIGSQRAFHRHSKSLSLPAKGSFIGNQTVIHRQLPTGRGLLCIFLKTPPRCGTRVTFLGHARQLITQKKCHPGEHLFRFVQMFAARTTMSVCGDVFTCTCACNQHLLPGVPPTFTADADAGQIGRRRRS